MKGMFKHTHCPLCQSEKFKSYSKVKDYSITKEIFKIDFCTNCGLRFTNPYPPIEKIQPYYKSENYISHNNKGNSLINLLYKIIRSFTLRSKVKIIKNFPGKRLLDIGCGTGLFLEASLKAGYEITGVETDEIARNNQSSSIKSQVYHSIANIGPHHQYDVITLWHVLEHIHDLTHSFPEIVNHLRHEGYIIVAVPNINSWDSKHYGNYWAALDVPRHLYHFTEEQINILFKKNGIALKAIHPMRFDAFYVSMLSEKYKGSSLVLQLINGFINGLISNFKAGEQNYSSLIFIGLKE